MRLKAFSLLTEEVIDLGLPDDDVDAVLQLGETAATGHDNLIVYVEGPRLQQWKGFS